LKRGTIYRVVENPPAHPNPFVLGVKNQPPTEWITVSSRTNLRTY
jgi:hypothetical protein